jgi:hypothetical protein
MSLQQKLKGGMELEHLETPPHWLATEQPHTKGLVNSLSTPLRVYGVSFSVFSRPRAQPHVSVEGSSLVLRAD